MRGLRRIAIALALCAGMTDANAAEYHWRVKASIENAVKLCKEHGGTPGTPDYDKLIRLVDVNNDARDDYVIDYRHIPCAGGAPDIFCSGDGFCSIEFLSWRAENEWKIFLMTDAADWRMRKGDKPALLLVQRGERYCDRRYSKRCTTVYTFRKGAMSVVSRDDKYFKIAK